MPKYRKLNTYPGSRPRKMRKMRGFQWRGFKVELYNNHYWSFRFEWQLRPLSQAAKNAVTYKGCVSKVIHDPTSMPSLKPTIYYAKGEVDMLLELWRLKKWREHGTRSIFSN